MKLYGANKQELMTVSRIERPSDRTEASHSLNQLSIQT